MIKIPGDSYSQRSKLNDVGQTPGRKGTTERPLRTRTTERSSRENNTVRVLNRAHLCHICRFSLHTRFLWVNSNGSSLWYLLQLLQQEQGSIKACVQLQHAPSKSFPSQCTRTQQMLILLRTRCARPSYSYAEQWSIKKDSKAGRGNLGCLLTELSWEYHDTLLSLNSPLGQCGHY